MANEHNQERKIIGGEKLGVSSRKQRKEARQRMLAARKKRNQEDKKTQKSSRKREEERNRPTASRWDQLIAWFRNTSLITWLSNIFSKNEKIMTPGEEHNGNSQPFSGQNVFTVLTDDNKEESQSEEKHDTQLSSDQDISAKSAEVKDENKEENQPEASEADVALENLENNSERDQPFPDSDIVTVTEEEEEAAAERSPDPLFHANDRNQEAFIAAFKNVVERFSKTPHRNTAMLLEGAYACMDPESRAENKELMLKMRALAEDSAEVYGRFKFDAVTPQQKQEQAQETTATAVSTSSSSSSSANAT